MRITKVKAKNNGKLYVGFLKADVGMTTPKLHIEDCGLPSNEFAAAMAAVAPLAAAIIGLPEAVQRACAFQQIDVRRKERKENGQFVDDTFITVTLEMGVIGSDKSAAVKTCPLCYDTTGNRLPCKGAEGPLVDAVEAMLDEAEAYVEAESKSA